MIERLVQAISGHTKPTDLRALAAQLVAENDALRLENAKLRAENRNLRRRLHDRELARLRRAEADCAMLGALHYAGLSTTATSAANYGISKRAWIAANGLLSLARVRMEGGRWRDVTMQEYEDHLRSAVAVVEREGAQVWALHMAKNGSRGLHVTNPRASEHHARERAQSNATRAKRDATGGGFAISAASGVVVGTWNSNVR